MNNKKVFLAFPISGFLDENEYQNYRKIVLNFIDYLRNNSFDIYSEIEHVIGINNYDSPTQSVNDDFKKLDDSDVFLLLHPKNLQTSTLIELGYAYAKNKAIVIVSPLSALPYLALGLPSVESRVRIIDVSDFNVKDFALVKDALN